MKYPNLLWLAALLLLVAACSKKESQVVTPVIPTPAPVASKIKATFSADTFGPGNIFYILSYWSTGFLNITNGKASDSFKYTITAVDTIVTGANKLDENGTFQFGAYDVSKNRFVDFGDGPVTVELTFKDTVLKASTVMERYGIRNYRDIMSLNSLGGIEKGETYRQLADVVFPDSAFVRAPVEFDIYGTYDGQGYKISNFRMTVNKAPNSNMITMLTLFRSAYEGAVLKNINLEYGASGITVGSGLTDWTRAAGLVGYASGSTIQNCSVKCDINCAEGTYVEGGGVVYRMSDSKIMGCSYTGKVTNCGFGGLTYIIGGSIDMCYAKYDFTGSQTAGVTYSRWANEEASISNTYTYINAGTATEIVSAFGKPEYDFVYANCFSNQATTEAGTAQYTTTALGDLVVENWPDGVSAAPGNKPFVADGAGGMKLWWQ